MNYVEESKLSNKEKAEKFLQYLQTHYIRYTFSEEYTLIVLDCFYWEEGAPLLPENICFCRDVYLKNYPSPVLPKKVTIEGCCLDISYSSISKIPDTWKFPNLTILIAAYSGLKEVPALDLIGLDIRNTFVTTLPEELNLCAWLHMEDTYITHFSNTLQITELHASGSKLEEIPTGFTWDILDISNTRVTQIPSNEQDWNMRDWGVLNISGTNILELPDRSYKLKMLDVSKSTLKRLPTNLIVRVTLDVTDVKFTFIPTTVKANTLLVSQHMRFEKNPSGISKIILCCKCTTYDLMTPPVLPYYMPLKELAQKYLQDSINYDRNPFEM